MFTLREGQCSEIFCCLALQWYSNQLGSEVGILFKYAMILQGRFHEHNKISQVHKYLNTRTTLNRSMLQKTSSRDSPSLKFGTK